MSRMTCQVLLDMPDCVMFASLPRTQFLVVPAPARMRGRQDLVEGIARVKPRGLLPDGRTGRRPPKSGATNRFRLASNDKPGYRSQTDHVAPIEVVDRRCAAPYQTLA